LDFLCGKGDITQKLGVCNTWWQKDLENGQNPVYLCRRNWLTKKYFYISNMKTNLQLITAAVLSVGGLILLFCGVFIDPEGQIHETLLVAFGETATFAGALFGIDYVYKQKK